jgi:hypothetical protein
LRSRPSRMPSPVASTFIGDTRFAEPVHTRRTGCGSVGLLGTPAGCLPTPSETAGARFVRTVRLAMQAGTRPGRCGLSVLTDLGVLRTLRSEASRYHSSLRGEELRARGDGCTLLIATCPHCGADFQVPDGFEVVEDITPPPSGFEFWLKPFGAAKPEWTDANLAHVSATGTPPTSRATPRPPRARERGSEPRRNSRLRSGGCESVGSPQTAVTANVRTTARNSRTPR